MGDSVKQKKRRRLKAELLVLFCVLVFWVVDLIPRAAAGAIRQVVRTALNCKYARKLLCDTYIMLERYDEADEVHFGAEMIACKRAVQLDPNNAQAHFDLAQSYQYDEEDNAEQAIEHYRAAVQLEPNWAGAWTFLGDAYMDYGSYERATNVCEEAVTLDLEDSYAGECLAYGYLNLGLDHEESGRHEEAQACFQKALQIDPNVPTTLFRSGNMNCEEGHWMNAIDDYRLSLKLRPKNLEVHYQLGKAYLQVGNKDLALKEYEILKDLDEELADGLLGLIEP